MEKQGVIYILTNPSFPEYVKIGYADNVESRLKQLNNSECIPFALCQQRQPPVVPGAGKGFSNNKKTSYKQRD